MSEKNIAKRYGGLKIVWHSDKLKSFVEDRVTAPIHVRLKPTNRCNHKCSFCSYDPSQGDITVRDEMFHREDEIPREKLLEILDDLKDMGVMAVTFSGGGEPLLHPNIVEALQKVKDSGVKYAIITNGQLLNEERAELLKDANWVRISTDASDAESFSQIRKVPEEWFHVLTENIRNFAKIKNPRCELGINFVVHEQNADQVYRSAGHFKSLGVNHIKITPMWIQNFMEYHKPLNEDVLKQIAKAKEDFEDENFSIYDTYKGDFSGASLSERVYPRCFVMQMNPAIGANSKVYFCHDKAYASTGVLGSIKDKSFKELWFSEEAKKIFKEFDPRQGCQHHCAGDSKNELVNSFIDCYGDDVGFI